MTNSTRWIGLLWLIAASAAVAFGQDKPEAAKDAKPTPVELGKVDWLRDFDQAKAQAAKSGKPILLLFDEVPGCGGCKRFGKLMLSHPLVVDAAEEAFVPMAVRNNSKGDADAALVKTFGMPRWSYPEIRFLDPDNPGPKGDLIPRAQNTWRKLVLPGRMVAALRKADRPVPPYLEILATETEAKSLKTACFWMSCYWVGEVKVGAADGVRAIRIGWLNKKEVVEVDFDPEVTSFEELAKLARESCGRKVGVFARSKEQLAAARKLDMPAKAVDDPVKTEKVRQKRMLMVRHPDVWFLPLSEYQAVRLNAVCRGRPGEKKVEALLSPTQKALRKKLAQVDSGQELIRRLIQDVGLPKRGFAQTIAWQAKLEEYLARQ